MKYYVPTYIYNIDDEPRLRDIASGFSLSKDVKLTLKPGAKKFINKPYTLELLGETVKEALHS